MLAGFEGWDLAEQPQKMALSGYHYHEGEVHHNHPVKAVIDGEREAARLVDDLGVLVGHGQDLMHQPWVADLYTLHTPAISHHFT